MVEGVATRGARVHEDPSRKKGKKWHRNGGRILEPILGPRLIKMKRRTPKRGRIMDPGLGPRPTLRGVILRPLCGPGFGAEIWTQFGVHWLAANTCVTFRCKPVSVSKTAPDSGPANQTEKGQRKTTYVAPRQQVEPTFEWGPPSLYVPQTVPTLSGHRSKTTLHTQGQCTR